MTDRTEPQITAADAATLIERAMNALLPVRPSPGGGGDDPALSFGIRAEAASLDALLVRLSESLADEVDHRTHLVTRVRMDGLLRTDDGLTAWGYALAVPGAHELAEVLAIEQATVDRDAAGRYHARLTLSAPSPASLTL